MSNVSLWTRRDPFAEFDAIVRRTFGPAARTSAALPTGFTPAAEIDRDGDDAVVRLELPGVDTEKDVVVELDRGRLVVRGERTRSVLARAAGSAVSSEERTGRTLSEVRYGSFRRSFGLPAHVKADALSASYDAGVLSIRVAGAYAGNEAQRIAVTSTVDSAVESGADSAVDSVVDATPEIEA